MRILYLANAEDVHTYRWVKYFADKGNEIHVISFKSSKDLENLKNVHLHLLKRSHIFENWALDNIILYLHQRTHLGATVFNPFFVLKQVKKLIKEIKPNVLHGFSIIHHTIVAALTGFHPFVVTAWGSDVLIYPKESKIMKYAVPFALRRADIIICGGENTKEAMMQMGIESEKINIIMPGVDIKKFKHSKGGTKLRKDLKIFNAPIVISTRRLGRIHDVGTLIKSIPLILKVIPDAKFIIVGSGEQKQYLMDLAKSINVIDATRFVGWIPNDTLPKYLASSDVYVSTSLSDDGLSTTTAEAMACELPVVITDFGDNGKWVEDGVNGFIVPLKDPKALAEKIIYLLKNPDVGKVFGMRNRKIIEESYNYYKEMEKMENIYIELIKRYKS